MSYDETGAVLHVSASAVQHRRGVVHVAPPVVAANGSRYAYSYFRLISSLYLVEGLGK